jgi:23S rRNA pseudouridine955/2504/2580 synthase
MKEDPNASLKRWRVAASEAGMTLIAFLREKNSEAFSVKALKRAIDGKCCTVNNQTEVFSTRRLKKDDIVVLQITEGKAVSKASLIVLYEDDDLLCVDKPAGLVCENRYFAPLLEKRAQLIHRLDKETSGVLLLGKNVQIIELMIALFRQKAVHKQYLALVDGYVHASSGKIENALIKKKGASPGQVIYGATQSKGGAPALTYWKCLQRSKTANASLLLCEPLTGRTHQLRVHMSGMGHPILGDTQYAKKFYCALRPQRQLLHAYRLSFKHPKTSEEIILTAALPQDFKQALNKLGLKESL